MLQLILCRPVEEEQMISEKQRYIDLKVNTESNGGKEFSNDRCTIRQGCVLWLKGLTAVISLQLSSRESSVVTGTLDDGR